MDFSSISVSESINWIITLLIGLATLYLGNFYYKVLRLPKGPFPLPFIGNILTFRGTKVNPFITVNELHKKYGPVFTIWFGSTPGVVIGDHELIKTAFNSKDNELMGRPNISIRDFITQGDGSDVVFTDHGPVWASLRRLAHSAARKLAVSDKLAYLVDEVVDQGVTEIKSNIGLNKPFDPKSFIYMIVYNIIASSAFGKRYKWGDEELKFYENSFEFFRNNSNSLAIADRVPILKPFYYKKYKQVGDVLKNLSLNVRQKYIAHLPDHQKGLIRDFCDALIEAKEEAIIENKESAPHFTDKNLSLVILNLFFAGSDTSQYMMRWIILLMANNIKMQMKMRAEVESVIGDRVATHEDRNECHYVNAFIAESLRFRGVAPLGVPHRALADYQLGKHTILADSFVFGNLLANATNKNLWDEPNRFDPNRFITSEGTFDPKKVGFTPFGVGRRICLGEKLALNDLFLITVRLLKSTSGQVIALPSGDGTADLEPNADIAFFSVPKPFEIIIKTK